MFSVGPGLALIRGMKYYLQLLLVTILALNIIACGEQTSNDGGTNNSTNLVPNQDQEFHLQRREEDYYQINFPDFPDKSIYLYNLIDGFGQVAEDGSAGIWEANEGIYDGDACYVRFLIHKEEGLNEYSIKIGTVQEPENCLILKGEFKLTLTGDHSARLELVTREIGFF